MKVLISDNLAPVGAEILKKAGLEVDINTGLAPEELKKIIPAYDGLVIRSATKVTAEILDAAANLKVVGRAGIGLDNVDIPAASKKGVVVMNAPDGNATTAAEHAIAMMMALTRNIPQATASMKAGKWEKKKFGGREVTGKTLGVYGIGRIGSIAASRAKGLRMNVIAYDPHMPRELVEKQGVELVDSKEEFFRRSDYITVHVPLIKETTKCISTQEFSWMKNDAMLIDCARGGVVDEEALYKALTGGEIAGAALDVFEVEPTTLDNPLLGLDNFICTPHLGASTAEAQENVAVAIAEQMADYLNNGTITNAVNVPSVSAEVMAQVGPFVRLADMLGSFHMQIASGGVEEINLEYVGDLAELDTNPVTVAFLKGLFTPILKEAVNFINAPMIAKERGIKVTESKTSDSDDFTSLLQVTVRTSEGENVLAGTVFGKSEPRLVRLNAFRLEVLPAGPMLYVHNKDVPGVIGALGSTIGGFGVNIRNMTVGREDSRDENIILLKTDKVLDKEQLAQVAALENVSSAMVLEMPTA